MKLLLVLALFGVAAAVDEGVQTSMYNYGKTYKVMSVQVLVQIR